MSALPLKTRLDRLYDQLGNEPRLRSLQPDMRAAIKEIEKLERERDEAREQADPAVCCSIDCGSTFPNKDGWRMDCEADEYEIRYAANRGLIVRHPERPTWLRFTKAGKEWL